MKLRETTLIKPIIEEKDRSKLPETVLCRVTYNICNIGERNANKRVYEQEVWDGVLGNDTLKEMIENRRLFGQAEHPTETQSDLQLTSHVIHNMWIKENTNKVFQTLDVLDTPMGRIVDCLLRAGCGVGVSTRAEGDLEESEDDEGTFSRVIPESYRYITTDFTADPSTFDVLPIDVKRNVVSSVRAEMENKDATEGERKFAMQLFESLKVEDKKEIKEKKYIKEGVWALPSSTEKAQELANLLKDPISFTNLHEGMWDLYGTDTMYDELDGLQDKILPGALSIVKKHLQNTLEDYRENPKDFKVPFDNNAIEILSQAVSENKTLEQAIKDKLITIGKKVKYENKDYKVATMDESVGEITIGPDIEGREVRIEQDGVLIDGNPFVKVHNDGTVMIMPNQPVEIDITSETEPELPPEGELPVQDELEPESEELGPDVEEKCDKDSKDKKKMKEGFQTDLKNKDKAAIKKRMGEITDKLLAGESLGGADKTYWNEYHKEVNKLKESVKEGMDQLVARKEELLVKKEAGMCTEAEQKELEDIEKQIKDMDVDIEEETIPEYRLPSEGGVSDIAATGNILKKGEETWTIKTLESGGITVNKIGEPGTEKHLPWDDIAAEGFVKIGEKVDEEEMNVDISENFEPGVTKVTLVKDPNVSGTVQEVHGIKGILVKWDADDKEDWLAPEDLKIMEGSTDLQIKEAITRAEKEKALETIGEISTELDKVKNESSDSELKLNMLMGKLKEATSVYDEVGALRTKLEEKARVANLAEKIARELKTKLVEETKRNQEAKKAICSMSENHRRNVNSINESNQNRNQTVKEDYEEQINEGKQEGIKEGIAKGIATVLSDYVDRRLAELDLSIGENTRALLDECGSIEDVEDVLGKTKDIQRRNALHSEPIEGIRVIRSQNLDPEQEKVDREVGNAFEGMR